MIVLDNEPLSIVERPGFTRLLEQALPRYKLPSRIYITQKIIPDIYDRIYEKIKYNISSASTISVTSDIWTCLHNNASFLSFTAHWISPDFKLEHGALAMKPFPGSHTGENIANELNIVANRWDIEYTKIHLLVHDSGANMVKGVRLAEYDSARCFIQTLQRVINDSLKVQAEVTTMIAAGRRLVTHFNHSGLAQEKLLKIQKELNLPEHHLVQDISTRRNSTLYMIERTPDVPPMRASLKAELETRFNSISQDSNYLIATYLDPRFKNNYLGVLEAEKVRQEILLEYLKMSFEESSSSSLSSISAKNSRGEEAEAAVSRKAHDTFWDCFDEVANEYNTSQTQSEERNAISCELDFYPKSERIDRNCDPYSWWAVNSKRYPNLGKFAQIYLSAPCSSVYSERLFSEAGLIYEDKRNRLLPLNAEKLVFIHHNLPLVQYEY